MNFSLDRTVKAIDELILQILKTFLQYKGLDDYFWFEMYCFRVNTELVIRNEWPKIYWTGCRDKK